RERSLVVVQEACGGRRASNYWTLVAARPVLPTGSSVRQRLPQSWRGDTTAEHARCGMTAVIEVFADVRCPFTHVGLTRFVARRHELGRREPRLRVRAWPLELVNGEPLS